MNSEKCRTAALRYAGMYVKTRGQTEDYLRRKGFDKEETEDALNMLEESGYMDDTSYCRNYYVEACRKGRGHRRIIQELERKKIKRKDSEAVLAEFLSEENPEYRQLMNEILTEKQRALKTAVRMLNEARAEGRETDNNFMAKVARRLYGLGFGSETIYSVMGAVMKESRKTNDR